MLSYYTPSGHGGVHVVGAGGHGKVAIRTLQELGWCVEAFVDDDQEKWGTTIHDVPVVGGLQQLVNGAVRPTIIAVGDNGRRKEIAETLRLPSMSVVHARAFIDASAHIGQGTVGFAYRLQTADSGLPSTGHRG